MNDNNPWGSGGNNNNPWSGGGSNNNMDFEDTIKKAKDRFGKFKIGAAEQYRCWPILEQNFIQ